MFRLILTSLLTVFAVADHPLYSTECLHAWEPLTVIQWARASYSENENFIAALEKMKINGKVLKMLDDLDFKDDLGITSSILRKKILSEVQDLASACEKKEPDYINDDDDYTPDHEVNAKDPATAKILRRMKEASDKKNAMKDSNDVAKKDNEQESYLSLWDFFAYYIGLFSLIYIGLYLISMFAFCPFGLPPFAEKGERENYRICGHIIIILIVLAILILYVYCNSAMKDSNDIAKKDDNILYYVLNILYNILYYVVNVVVSVISVCFWINFFFKDKLEEQNKQRGQNRKSDQKPMEVQRAPTSRRAAEERSQPAYKSKQWYINQGDPLGGMFSNDPPPCPTSSKSNKFLNGIINQDFKNLGYFKNR